MRQFEIRFTEHFSDVKFMMTQEGWTLLNIEQDGWGEFQYVKRFEAKDIKEAKKIADSICDTSSRVFDVYEIKLAFTEENL